MIKKIALLFLLFFDLQIKAQSIKVSSGKIERFENFNSQFVDARNIDVWLPDGYSKNEKYAVLYMHDGQALYDAENTWNKQSWEVDETASKLINLCKTRKFIVVGIWNNGLKRHPEYFPQKPYQTFDANQNLNSLRDFFSVVRSSVPKSYFQVLFVLILVFLNDPFLYY